MIKNVAVAGAGTMGNGIALSASLAGYEVILFDTSETVIKTAKETINKNLAYLLSKGKISAEGEIEISSRIYFTTDINECKASLIIEAIVEKLEIKRSLFTRLSIINNPETIFASNTSSLSITAIQEGMTNPQKFAGLHFFNPAQVMKLVEVIIGKHTSDEVIISLSDFSKKLGKVPVVCTDSPGFIVNRVARHYYLEAMKLAEDGIATYEQIDEIMEASGFKMGPFRLMDMIGMDINLAVSQSLYHAFNEEERFKPSQIQVNKVEKGELGRKSGKGFYNY